MHGRLTSVYVSCKSPSWSKSPVLLEVCPNVAAIKRLVADVVRQSYLSTLPIDALALLRVRLVAAIVVPARVLHSLVLVALRKILLDRYYYCSLPKILAEAFACHAGLKRLSIP
ncbi:hypothetical protein MJO28_000565 [Puccinia striiformis f. sp. tritici]|uniref:Uncharacterized protein n=1 Tax=Puccinia striiformis f. sp. tritici TaxID=168172 RepID=A0ACC0EY86_9BASI|nr:hypothetical protein MJO28_000565 [Puccinia striiformis f. sp. tritici]